MPVEAQPVKCVVGGDNNTANKMAKTGRPPRISERYKRVNISTRNQVIKDQIKLATLTLEDVSDSDCDDVGLIELDRPKNPSPPEEVRIIDSFESMKTNVGSMCSKESAEVIGKKTEDPKGLEVEKVTCSVEGDKNIQKSNDSSEPRNVNPEPTTVNFGQVNANHESSGVLAEPSNASTDEPSRVAPGSSRGPTFPSIDALPGSLVQANYKPVVPVIQQQQQSIGNQQPKRYHYQRTASPIVKPGAYGTTFTTRQQRQTGLLPQVLNHRALFAHVKPFKDHGEDLYKRVSYSRHLVNEVLMPSCNSISVSNGIGSIEGRRLEPEDAGQGVSVEGKGIIAASGGDAVQRGASTRIDGSSKAAAVSCGSGSTDDSGYLRKNAFDARRTKIHRMSDATNEGDANVAHGIVQGHGSKSQNEDENQKDSNDDGQYSTPVGQMMGDVGRVNVKAAGSDEPRPCRHGRRRVSCTLCSRPTGRVGREFKARQDEYNNMLDETRRRRQRRRGRKNGKCNDQAYSDMECAELDENLSDEELFKLIIQAKTVHRKPSTALYPSFAHYIISQSHYEVLFADVLIQLRTSGFHVETCTLLVKKTHFAFSTVHNAFTLNIWLQR
eukprot:gene10134-11169_t